MEYKTTLDLDLDEPLDCGECGWTGRTGRALEHFDELVAVRCPTCDEQLGGLYMHPTADDIRQEAAAGNPRAVAQLGDVVAQEERWDRAEDAELSSVKQLRDVRGRRSFVVDWCLEDGDTDNWVVLRVQGREIGRELAIWEGLERFRAVAVLLADRYPGRVQELRPDPGEATTYLLGDRLSSINGVEEANAEIFGSRPRTRFLTRALRRNSP